MYRGADHELDLRSSTVSVRAKESTSRCQEDNAISDAIEYQQLGEVFQRRTIAYPETILPSSLSCSRS